MIYNHDYSLNYTGSKYVSFQVWNDRLRTVFDVSRIGSVLIPQSSDNFTLYFTALGGNYNISLLTSAGTILKGAFALLGLSLAALY